MKSVSYELTLLFIFVFHRRLLIDFFTQIINLYLELVEYADIL